MAFVQRCKKQLLMSEWNQFLRDEEKGLYPFASKAISLAPEKREN